MIERIFCKCDRVDHLPTSSELSGKLCNACIPMFGTLAMIASVLSVVYDDDR